MCCRDLVSPPGLRGELVAQLLSILARDAAVRKMRENEKLNFRWKNEQENDGIWERSIPVDKFLCQLLNVHHKDAEGLAEIVTEFADCRVHFNHFVKVYEEDVILDKQCLAGLLTRGAAIACVDHQESIDILFQVLRPNYQETETSKNRYRIHNQRIVVIVLQIKGGRKFQATPQWPRLRSHE